MSRPSATMPPTSGAKAAHRSMPGSSSAVRACTMVCTGRFAPARRKARSVRRWASARAEGYGDGTDSKTQPAPYHGYFYKILTRQGAAAPGGARDYMVGAHLTGGFALIAFPAEYGDSGVMTFIVDRDGIVYEKGSRRQDGRRRAGRHGIRSRSHLEDTLTNSSSMAQLERRGVLLSVRLAISSATPMPARRSRGGRQRPRFGHRSCCSCSCALCRFHASPA